MMNILIEGSRLRLRKAVEQDLDFILDLEYAEDNLPFIVPFDRDFHTNIITGGEASMDVIVEEVATGAPVGYFLVAGLKTEAREMEWTHVIIAKKGMGYGHEAMQLIKKWCFAVKKFHRAWLDCKDYNERALHLYESEGMVREGLIRETIITNGKYENLVILGILDREYEARRAEGKEIG